MRPGTLRREEPGCQARGRGVTVRRRARPGVGVGRGARISKESGSTLSGMPGSSIAPMKRIDIAPPRDRYSYAAPGQTLESPLRSFSGQRPSREAAFSLRSSRTFAVSSRSTRRRPARRIALVLSGTATFKRVWRPGSPPASIESPITSFAGLQISSSDSFDTSQGESSRSRSVVALQARAYALADSSVAACTACADGGCKASRISSEGCVASTTSSIPRHGSTPDMRSSHSTGGSLTFRSAPAWNLPRATAISCESRSGRPEKKRESNQVASSRSPASA